MILQVPFENKDEDIFIVLSSSFQSYGPLQVTLKLVQFNLRFLPFTIVLFWVLWECASKNTEQKF